MIDVNRLDELLTYFYAHPINTHRTMVQNHFHAMKRDFDVPTLNILHSKLVKDGYLRKVHDADPIYVITYEGMEFCKKGGYRTLLKRQAIAREKAEERVRLESDQIQSVIDTEALPFLGLR